MSQTPIPYLGALWPLFVMAEQSAEDCQGLSALDVVVPEDPETLRLIYLGLLRRVDPVAADGLERTPAEELTDWVTVLRGPLLTGADDELTWLPAGFVRGGRLRRGLVALLRLPLWERLDTFQTALHRAVGRAA